MNNKQTIKQDGRPTSAGSTMLSENQLQKWLIAVGLVAIPVVLFALYYKAMFPGLVNSDALDFAQLGRNLSQGRGFVTYFLRPLALTHSANPLHQPDVTHGPLYPFLLALAIGARGANDAAVAQMSGIFYLLTVPVLYWLGTKVFNRGVGLLAALVYAANPLMLEYSISGMHITFYIFLMTCLLLVIYNIAAYTRNHDKEPAMALPKMQLFLAGSLTGALYLADPVFICVAPVTLTAVALLHEKRRGQALLWLLLPFSVLVLPWMIRNTLLTGNPVFGLRGMEVWMGTKGYYPGSIGYRMTAGDVVPGIGLFKAVISKMLLSSGQVVQAFPQVSASWMLAFLLPSLFFRFKDPAIGVLRRVMMYSFLGVLLVSLVLGINMPLFTSLIPTMLVFAIAYLMHVAGEAQLTRQALTLMVFLLGMAVVLPMLSETVFAEKPTALSDAPTARLLSKMAPHGAVVLSDQPGIVAWYGDRPSVWIPAMDKKVGEIRKRFPQMSWMLLTEQTRGISPEWRSLYHSFFQWNLASIQAQARSQRLNPARITGKGHPLLEGLNGFTAVLPVKGASPTTVLATVTE